MITYEPECSEWVEQAWRGSWGREFRWTSFSVGVGGLGLSLEPFWCSLWHGGVGAEKVGQVCYSGGWMVQKFRREWVTEIE